MTFTADGKRHRLPLIFFLLLFTANTNIFTLLYRQLTTEGKNFIFAVWRNVMLNLSIILQTARGEARTVSWGAQGVFSHLAGDLGHSWLVRLLFFRLLSSGCCYNSCFYYIERFSFECRKVIGLALATLHDWLKKFASAACNYFEFSHLKITCFIISLS